MVFKQGWENNTNTHNLTHNDILKIVATLAPNKELQTWQKLSGGLSHATFKILLPEEPYIVRLSQHEPTSLYKEQSLAQHLRKDIPIAQIFHIAEVECGVAALMEMRDGITLSTLITTEIDDYALGLLAREAAHILVQLQAYTFEKSGFLNNALHIDQPFDEKAHLTFSLSCLSKLCVQQVLGKTLCNQTERLLLKLGDLLSPSHTPHLVHADFDPANLLVNQTNGTWHISTVLDWEYAFAGSYHQDMANWLRWAPQMPKVYECEFLNELSAHGINLDKEDMTRVRLLDLSALLDLLARSTPEDHPKRCEELKHLIIYLVKNLT